LNCLFSSQHSTQSVNFYNQLNQVSNSIASAQRKKHQVVLLPDGRRQHVNGFLYNVGEIKQRELKAQELLKQRQLLKETQHKVLVNQLEQHSKKKEEHEQIVHTVHNSRQTLSDIQAQLNSIREERTIEFQQKSSMLQQQIEQIQQEMVLTERESLAQLDSLEKQIQSHEMELN